MWILHILLRAYLVIDRREHRAALVYIFNGNNVVLIKKAYGREGWTPPGGFISRREDSHSGAAREVFEEVGLSPSHLELISAEREKRRFVRLTLFSFYAKEKTRGLVVNDREIQQAAWFSIEKTRGMLRHNKKGFEKALKMHKQHGKK